MGASAIGRKRPTTGTAKVLKKKETPDDLLLDIQHQQRIKAVREFEEMLAADRVLSRSALEIDGAVSGRMRILGQAARSIGLSASFWFRVCHPSILRMVI